MSVNSAPNWNSMPMRAAQRVELVARRGRAPTGRRRRTRAGLRAELAADQAQDRRLAAARAAHDRDDLAARDRHVDAAQHRPPAVVAERDVGHLDGVGRQRRRARRRARRGRRARGHGCEGEEDRDCSRCRFGRRNDPRSVMQFERYCAGAPSRQPLEQPLLGHRRAPPAGRAAPRRRPPRTRQSGVGRAASARRAGARR